MSKRKENLICGVMKCLNEKVFKGSDQYRFTIFQPSSEIFALMPIYRYESQQSGRGFESQAQFPKKVGLAGISWSKPNHVFAVHDIPVFEDEDSFISFWSDRVGIDLRYVRRLSPASFRIRSMMCVGLLGHMRDFLGTLSIDCFDNPRGFEEIGVDDLRRFQHALSSVLELPA